MGGGAGKFFLAGVFRGRGKGGWPKAARRGRLRPASNSREDPTEAELSEALARMLESVESPFEPFVADPLGAVAERLPGRWGIPERPELFWNRFPRLREVWGRLVAAYFSEELFWLRLSRDGADAKMPQEYGPASFSAALLLYDAALLSGARLLHPPERGSDLLYVFDRVRIFVKNHLEGLERLLTWLAPGDLAVLFLLSDHVSALAGAFDAMAASGGGRLSPLAGAWFERLSPVWEKNGVKPSDDVLGNVRERLGRISGKISDIRNICRNSPDRNFAKLCGLVWENEALSSLVVKRILEQAEPPQARSGKKARVQERGGEWFPADRVFGTAQKRLEEAMAMAARPVKDPGSAAVALGILRFFALFGAGLFRRSMESEAWAGLSGLNGYFSSEMLAHYSGMLENELEWCSGFLIGDIGVMYAQAAGLFVDARNWARRI